jgi:hypothetical protein
VDPPLRERSSRQRRASPRSVGSCRMVSDSVREPLASVIDSLSYGDIGASLCDARGTATP